MSSDTPAIRITDLGKCYKIYSSSRDRLKQAIIPRLMNLVGVPDKKYYRDFWALRNVSFEVAQGETVGIIGRNGSGKSTLLQMICGTLQPTEGSVRTQGRVAALLELGAGFNPEFTGRENVYMNAAVLGLQEDEIDQRYQSIADFADIGDFIEQPVKHYSSGMYARLAFAVAVSVDPRILVVDEALAVGDEAFQRKCFARMEEIKRSGGSILLVTHSSNNVTSLCDRAILLSKGKCLFSGNPKLAIAWYQKLASGNEENINLLISEIEEQKALVNPDEEGRDSRFEGISAPYCPPATDFKAGFDAELTTASTVIYEPRGAEISEVILHDSEGNQVNELVNSERYRISYHVKFFESFSHIRMNSMIRTVIGQELGGGTYPSRAENGSAFNQGDEVTITYDFECTLAGGTYYLNCGVLDSGHVLHRILDALCFKVFSDNNTWTNGTVDFKIQSSIHKRS